MQTINHGNLAELDPQTGATASMRCPHCDHVVEVPSRESEESARSLAAWRLAVHVNTAHPEVVSASLS